MKLTINYKKSQTFIFWMMVLLPIYKVGYIGEMPILNSIYDFGRYFSICVCGIITIKIFHTLLKDKNMLLLFFVKFLIVILTVVMGVSNNDCIYSFVLVVVQGIFFTYMLEKDAKLSISVYTFIFEIIVYINFITLILHPEGLYNFGGDRIYTFIGHANNTTYYTLPLATLALIDLSRKRNLVRAFMDIVVCVSSAILVKSSSGIVVYFCFTIILIWEWKKSKIIKVSYFTIYLVIMALSCGFIFLNMQVIFSSFIEDILHREINFTGRTYYWGKTLLMIKNNPVWGHGAVPGDIRWGGLSAHSYILETLYEGGIILLALFTFLFYRISKKLEAYNQFRIARILFSALVAITITCISESNISNDVFFIMFIWTMKMEFLISGLSDKSSQFNYKKDKSCYDISKRQIEI